MADPIIVTKEDLSGAPSTQTINSSVRSLRALKIDTSQPFTPSPDTVEDINGKSISSGITKVEGGKVEFMNPKDSADSYCKQTYDVNNGVMILPGKDEAQVAEINAVVDQVVGKKDTITLAEFDQVLKKMQEYYAEKGQPADIYNSTTVQLDPARHTKIGDDTYVKAAVPETIYFVEVPAGQTVGYSGSTKRDGHSGEQFSQGSFVVTMGTDPKTKEPYDRKLDLEYAKENLRDAKTGKKVDLDAVPKISLDAIMAKRAPDTKGQDGSVTSPQRKQGLA